MEKQKFVLQALTGQEGKVKKSLDARKIEKEMQEYIGDVIVPTEKVSEVRNGKKSTVTRKLFPGYVFLEAALFDNSGKKPKLIEATWLFLRETPGLLFAGEKKALPTPLSDEEWNAVVNQTSNKNEVKPKVQFSPGDQVSITDGPFMSFEGVVDEVDPEHGKLKVSVSIFGRTAPVELEYWQVERIEKTESSPSLTSIPQDPME